MEIKMATPSEKRQYQRHSYETPLYLYRYDARERFYAADMYNYSQGGMYLKTNRKMDINQQVYIKIRDSNEKGKGPGKDEYYSGYVKWSEDLGTSSPGGQYGYGVEYEVPVDF